MKKIKRIFAIFLSAVLIAQCMPFSVSASVDISDKISTESTYEFSSINENAPSDSVNRVTMSITDKMPEEPTPEEPEPEEPEPEEPEPEDPDPQDPDPEEPGGDDTTPNESGDWETEPIIVNPEDPDPEDPDPEDPEEPENPEEPGKMTVLNVDYTCEIEAIEYRVGLTKVGGGFKTLCFADPEDRSTEEVTCNGFSASVNLEGAGLEEGNYYIQIARARNEEQQDHYSFGDGGNCYRNVLINIDENGEASFVDYCDIQAQNESVYTNPLYLNPEFYTDKTMEDVPFCLHNLVNDTGATKPTKLESEKASLTSTQLKFIENLAKDKTKNCEGVYNKAKAIYSYVSANTYYDDYSNNHSAVKTINNPYTNLKKISDGENAFTCCVGYASMMCAMLRSLGIPTRVVYGIHLSIPKESWNYNIDPENQKEDEHYWVEFFDGERWIIADANMGTSNKWYRDKSQFEGGNAGEKAQNSFTYFDPSPEQLAVSHCCLGVYSRTVIAAQNDVNKLSAFLNQKSGSTTNAKLLGSSSTFNANSGIPTWNSDIFYANYLTGEIEKIDFTKVTTLAGAADFSNCNGLKWFSASNNTKLTSLNLSGNTELLSAFASSCGLTKVDATGCKSITTLNAKFNPLTSAKYTFKTNKTASITATKGGTFYVGYENGKHNMKAYADLGYYFSGWFNSSGTKLSSAAEYTTSTTSSFIYTAKFVKLGTPQNVKITATSPTAQKISWDKVNYADGYWVYKSTSKNSGYVGTKVTGNATTSVTKTGLTTGKTYYYYVVAYKNVSGASYTPVSANSAIVSKQVVPPTPKVTLKTGSKYVSVSFPKIANVTGYEVYRATSSGGKYSLVKTVKQGSASTLTFKNTGLKKGKKYYYKVRAYKTVGSKKIYSAYSSVKNITCK